MSSHKDVTFTNAAGENFHLAVFGPIDAEMTADGKGEALPVLFCVHGAGMSGDNFFRLADALRSTSAASSSGSNTVSSSDAASPPAPQSSQRPSSNNGSGVPARPMPPLPPSQTVAPPPTCAPFSGVPDTYGDEVAMCVVTYDQRCHGTSTFNGGEGGLTLEVLVKDFQEVLAYVKDTLYPRCTFFVTGHSLGGSVVVHGLKNAAARARVDGILLFDVVEGTAKQSLKYMNEFLKKRPDSFDTVKEAETWFVHHGGMRSIEGAAVSVPPLLREEGGKYVWRTDLHKMESVWDMWFEGMDAAFLAFPHSKMLCLANAERLDTTLTVAQMQGKFQFEIIGNNCGHYIMDDATAVEIEFESMSWRKERCSGLWRSEDMVRMDLILQREVLHDTMLEIGMLGTAQFLDMNETATAFSRPFTSAIRRCEDMQRKLRYIEESFTDDFLLAARCEADFEHSATVEELRSSMLQGQIDMIDERIETTSTNLGAMLSSLEGFEDEMIANNEISLLYARLCDIMNSRGLLTDARSGAGHSFAEGVEMSSLSRLSTLLGIIDADKSELLYRLCYRVTRGNAIVEITNESNASGLRSRAESATSRKANTDSRAVATFVVFSSSTVMVSRLQKLVAGMGACVYTLADVQTRGEALLSGTATANGKASVASLPTPTVVASSSLMLSGNAARDLQSTIEAVKQRKSDLLLHWYREHRMYKAFLKVEKAVLISMNLCAFSGSTCTASAWIPYKHEEAIRRALDDAMASSGGEVQSIMTHHPDQRHPPTFFDTNAFTQSFQDIVDSYGVACYKEVNPGVFTIITFPYLFGIMYGDTGHGVLLLLGALYFIYKERDWKTRRLNEIVGMLYGGRYILLLMSLFAIYMGVLYNDFFGFSVSLFPSGYRWPETAGNSTSAGTSGGNTTVYPVEPNGRPSVVPTRVYPFGIDVAWAETENKLEFYNSVKMKCAVIVGVVQMFAGLGLSLSNHIHNRNWLKIGLLFVPEFVFLLATFGYMSVLIIVKWCLKWVDTHDAPSLLEVMTNFFLQPGSVPQPLFRGQASLQVVLLVIAFIMMPIMLCGMPIVEYRKYRKWLMRRRHLFDTSAVASATSTSAPAFFSGDVSEDSGGVTAQWRSSASAAVAVGDGGVGAGDNLVSDEDATVDIFDVVDDIVLAESRDEAEDEEFENFDLSEMIIHYVIHTIEYVLSCVSNTASYLRLWALSLAHAQLSEVFFTFTVVNLLNVDTTGFAIGFGVAAWLCATLCVLVGMEALSAFLHTLRLHWVEFQNKFYVGNGKAFEPLNLLCLNYLS